MGLLESSLVKADNTFAMTWSQQTFGPDGPWHAVQIQIGSQDTSISLYPGGTWQSSIFTPSICNNASLGDVCYAEAAGLYDNTTSGTAQFRTVSVAGDLDFTNGALQIGGQAPVIGTDSWNIGNGMETLQDMDMQIYTSIWGTLPDGSTYPLSVGSLTLGAKNTINQTFSRTSIGEVPFNGTLLPGWLETEALPNKVTSSNSYGLHIGSVDPKIEPSLLIGGYDQNRVLGTVSTQEGVPDSEGAIDLLDISLNVVSGQSPWNFTSLGGILASGNSSIVDALPVGINSLAPYLHLPKSTCDAIAGYLPVTYQAKYGLYFWNTADPQYGKIVSSPSCLSFTFRENESTDSNFTINVPFRLLNLTLTAPLTLTPTTYFPCKAEEATFYQLGRSFLQAAFVGANWFANDGAAAWWLAQAPGPNIADQPDIIVIGNTSATITGSSSDWASSWKGYWTELSAPSSSPTTSPPSQSSASSKSSSGLSTGAKAGVGVGVALGAIAVALGAFILWRRSRPKTSETHQQVATHEAQSSTESATKQPLTSFYESSGPSMVEADAVRTTYELQADP